MSQMIVNCSKYDIYIDIVLRQLKIDIDKKNKNLI